MLILLAAALAFGGSDLWHWVTHARKYEFFDGSCAGWFEVNRLTGRRGEARTWDVDTGFVVTSSFESEGVDRGTSWSPDGRILLQEWYEPGIAEQKSSPPWWWGETDQLQPSAPWILEGIPFEVWWERVRPRRE